MAKTMNFVRLIKKNYQPSSCYVLLYGFLNQKKQEKLCHNVDTKYKIFRIKKIQFNLITLKPVLVNF
jgi:hypothetical protein